MSTQRRILTALAVFIAAVSMLAVADAKKPAKLATLEKPVAQQSNEAPPEAPKAKPKHHAKKYMPVADFGDY